MERNSRRPLRPETDKDQDYHVLLLLSLTHRRAYRKGKTQIHSLDFDEFAAVDDLVGAQLHNGDGQVVVVDHNQGV